VLLVALALILASCGGDGGGGKEEEKDGGETKAAGGGGSTGQIAIEGSSTVIPITQGAAEGFNQQNPDVEITIGGAGTGDGFEAFCGGTTQISNASGRSKTRRYRPARRTASILSRSRWLSTASRSCPIRRTTSRTT
jgi:ABC-type phosphate transport system substrate-binding protein